MAHLMSRMHSRVALRDANRAFERAAYFGEINELYLSNPVRDAALKQIIRLKSDAVTAYYNLGLVFVAENRKDEAKAAFRQARQLGPDSPVGQAALDRLKALGEDG